LSNKCRDKWGDISLAESRKRENAKERKYEITQVRQSCSWFRAIPCLLVVFSFFRVFVIKKARGLTSQGTMSTLAVDMKTGGKSPHAHGKRGHGTHFLIIDLEH
jgi:hypothetical protein